MKILITGGNGMLGYDLDRVLSREHQVVACSIEELDISNIDLTLQVIKHHLPDLVINCAAYTDVDGCESNQSLAYRVNGLGARNVAIACQETGAMLYHISTDYVFDGLKSSPYREYDNVNPQGIYGKSKLLGESLIKEIQPRHCIIRTSWLYGLNGKNFVTTMLGLADKMPEIKVVNDQKGSPTYTLDLARAIEQMVGRPCQGTYHLTNSDNCSWYDFAVNIFTQADKEVIVNPITTEELGRPAPRPHNSVLDNFMWDLDGFAPLRSYQEALADYLSSI